MQSSFCETPAFGRSASAQIFPPSPDKDPRERSSSIGQRAGSISAVVDLLRLADKALSKNHGETRRCIEIALGLLMADSDAIDAVEQAGGPLRKTSLAPWQIRRVTSFIDSNLADTIRLRDLAAVTHLSARHFSRAFRSMIGESPYAYVMRRRIERAQEIMLRTDAPLAQIALDCGLADQAHFTRLFRRVLGTSPGAWRRLNGKTERDSVVPRRPHCPADRSGPPTAVTRPMYSPAAIGCTK
jgi:AraC family transcriptional regulator